MSLWYSTVTLARSFMLHSYTFFAASRSQLPDSLLHILIQADPVVLYAVSSLSSTLEATNKVRLERMNALIIQGRKSRGLVDYLVQGILTVVLFLLLLLLLFFTSPCLHRQRTGREAVVRNTLLLGLVLSRSTRLSAASWLLVPCPSLLLLMLLLLRQTYKRSERRLLYKVACWHGKGLKANAIGQELSLVEVRIERVGAKGRVAV